MVSHDFDPKDFAVPLRDRPVLETKWYFDLCIFEVFGVKDGLIDCLVGYEHDAFKSPAFQLRVEMHDGTEILDHSLPLLADVQKETFYNGEQKWTILEIR